MGDNNYILHAFKDILLLCLGVCCVSLWMYATYTWMLVEARKVCWGPEAVVIGVVSSPVKLSSGVQEEQHMFLTAKAALQPPDLTIEKDLLFYLCMCLCECMQTCLCRCPHRGLKRTSDPLELESQALLSPLPPCCGYWDQNSNPHEWANTSNL